MSNLQKLIDRLWQNPNNVRLEKIKQILSPQGYQLTHIKGSHHKFSKKDATPIIIPVHHNKVEKCYIKDILKTFYSQHS